MQCQMFSHLFSRLVSLVSLVARSAQFSFLRTCRQQRQRDVFLTGHHVPARAGDCGQASFIALCRQHTLQEPLLLRRHHHIMLFCVRRQRHRPFQPKQPPHLCQVPYFTPSQPNPQPPTPNPQPPTPNPSPSLSELLQFGICIAVLILFIAVHVCVGRTSVGAAAASSFHKRRRLVHAAFAVVEITLLLRAILWLNIAIALNDAAQVRTPPSRRRQRIPFNHCARAADLRPLARRQQPLGHPPRVVRRRDRQQLVLHVSPAAGSQRFPEQT